MTTFITLAWHITKKDLRALLWLIAPFVTLTVLQAGLRALWPPVMITVQPDVAYFLEAARTTLPLIRVLLFTQIVVVLIHADPLVTTDAFWLTRPIAPRVLFFSKLLTAALVLIFPTCLAQVALMLGFGVPLLDIASVTPEILFYTTAGLAAVLIGAALTANQRELIAWSVGLFILTFVVATLGADLFAQPPVTRKVVTPRELKNAAPWADVLIVTIVLLSTGFTAAAWHMYQTRRRVRSALIAAAVAGFTFFVATRFPSDAGPKSVHLWTLASPIPLGAALQYEDGPRSLAAWPIMEDSGNCHLLLRVTRVKGVRAYHDPPNLTYSFVHQPTGEPIPFNQGSLSMSRERAPAPLFYREDIEVFQIAYQHVWVGPFARARAPGDPEPRLKSVSCRDLAVSVKRQALMPYP